MENQTAKQHGDGNGNRDHIEVGPGNLVGAQTSRIGLQGIPYQGLQALAIKFFGF